MKASRVLFESFVLLLHKTATLNTAYDNSVKQLRFKIGNGGKLFQI